MCSDVSPPRPYPAPVAPTSWSIPKTAHTTMSRSLIPEAKRLPFGREFAALLAASQLVLVPAALAATANVTINTSQTKGTMPSQGLGVATAVYDNGLVGDGVAPALKANRIQAIRYPGGSYADAFHWRTSSVAPGSYMNPSNTFDNFMTKVVNPAGAKAIITVNYGSNEANNGGGDPNEAAGWVAYAKAHGYGIKYWEVGNEIQGNGYYGGNGWEYDLHAPYNGNRNRQAALSPSTYGQNAVKFITAMKAKDSSIKCGVSLVSPGTWPDNTTPSYNNDVLKNCANAIDFIVIHWYPDGSAASLLQSPSRIGSVVTAVRNQLSTYVGGTRANQIEILITETGSGTVNGPAAALFAADNYLTWFEHGSTNVDWQELHTNFLSQTNAALGPLYAVRMVATLASAGDTFVNATSNSNMLAAHAVKKANGSTGILLINRDPNNSYTVNVSATGTTFTTTANRVSFGTANFNGNTPSSGPASSTLAGVGSTSFSVTVPAYTMTVLTIAKDSTTPPPPPPPPPAGNGTLGNGTYRMVAHHSGKALDVAAGATADGSGVIQWPYHAGNNQRWVVAALGNGKYRITSVASGKALEINGWSTANGGKADIWTVTNGANQSWTVTSNGNGYYRVLNGNGGLALEVNGASQADGAVVDQWAYTGGSNQEWSFLAP